MRLQLNRPAPAPGIGLTPLIDVVFILLLFFMLATNFQRWHAIDIDAAAALDGPASESSTTLLLELHADGMAFEGESVSISSLGAVLSMRLRLTPEAEILVTASEEVSLQSIVSVMDVVRENGVRQAGFSVR